MIQTADSYYFPSESDIHQHEDVHDTDVRGLHAYPTEKSPNAGFPSLRPFAPLTKQALHDGLRAPMMQMSPYGLSGGYLYPIYPPHHPNFYPLHATSAPPSTGPLHPHHPYATPNAFLRSPMMTLGSLSVPLSSNEHQEMISSTLDDSHPYPHHHHWQPSNATFVVPSDASSNEDAAAAAAVAQRASPTPPYPIFPPMMTNSPSTMMSSNYTFQQQASAAAYHQAMFMNMGAGWPDHPSRSNSASVSPSESQLLFTPPHSYSVPCHSRSMSPSYPPYYHRSVGAAGRNGQQSDDGDGGNNDTNHHAGHLLQSPRMACKACIRGHRAPSCKHTDRPLFPIRPRGRPANQCVHCKEARRNSGLHVKCLCGTFLSSTDAPAEQSTSDEKSFSVLLQPTYRCLCHLGLPCLCGGKNAPLNREEQHKKSEE